MEAQRAALVLLYLCISSQAVEVTVHVVSPSLLSDNMHLCGECLNTDGNPVHMTACGTNNEVSLTHHNINGYVWSVNITQQLNECVLRWKWVQVFPNGTKTYELKGQGDRILNLLGVSQSPVVVYSTYDKKVYDAVLQGRQQYVFKGTSSAANVPADGQNVALCGVCADHTVYKLDEACTRITKVPVQDKQWSVELHLPTGCVFDWTWVITDEAHKILQHDPSGWRRGLSIRSCLAPPSTLSSGFLSVQSVWGQSGLVQQECSQPESYNSFMALTGVQHSTTDEVQHLTTTAPTSTVIQALDSNTKPSPETKSNRQTYSETKSTKPALWASIATLYSKISQNSAVTKTWDHMFSSKETITTTDVTTPAGIISPNDVTLTQTYPVSIISESIINGRTVYAYASQATTSEAFGSNKTVSGSLAPSASITAKGSAEDRHKEDGYVNQSAILNPKEVTAYLHNGYITIITLCSGLAAIGLITAGICLAKRMKGRRSVAVLTTAPVSEVPAHNRSTALESVKAHHDYEDVSANASQQNENSRDQNPIGDSVYDVPMKSGAFVLNMILTERVDEGNPNEITQDVMYAESSH